MHSVRARTLSHEEVAELRHHACLPSATIPDEPRAKRSAAIAANDKNQAYSEEEQEDGDGDVEFNGERLFCLICKSKEDEDSMLICDGCDNGYHMACLRPPLRRIPEGDW